MCGRQANTNTTVLYSAGKTCLGPSAYVSMSCMSLIVIFGIQHFELWELWWFLKGSHCIYACAWLLFVHFAPLFCVWLYTNCWGIRYNFHLCTTSSPQQQPLCWMIIITHIFRSAFYIHRVLRALVCPMAMSLYAFCFIS